MGIFHSYVKLPEDIWGKILPKKTKISRVSCPPAWMSPIASSPIAIPPRKSPRSGSVEVIIDSLGKTLKVKLRKRDFFPQHFGECKKSLKFQVGPSLTLKESCSSLLIWIAWVQGKLYRNPCNPWIPGLLHQNTWEKKSHEIYGSSSPEICFYKSTGLPAVWRYNKYINMYYIYIL